MTRIEIEFGDKDNRTQFFIKYDVTNPTQHATVIISQASLIACSISFRTSYSIERQYVQTIQNFLEGISATWPAGGSGAISAAENILSKYGDRIFRGVPKEKE